MEEQEVQFNAGMDAPEPAARKPWHAPVMTVSSVEQVTQVAAINYPLDATNIGS